MYLDERFWSKVDKTSTCWNWTAAKSSKGYGRFRFNGKLESPHVLSFIEVHGEIPEDHEVCHKCDNPSCVRPSHLFSGTRSDNMVDCVNKGRQGSKLKEFCGNGHKMSGENVHYNKDGSRYCNQCNKVKSKRSVARYRARQKQREVIQG